MPNMRDIVKQKEEEKAAEEERFARLEQKVDLILDLLASNSNLEDSEEVKEEPKTSLDSLLGSANIAKPKPPTKSTK